MALILQQIGTPLQLVALLLLSLAGLARVSLGTGALKRPGTITRLVINRMFQAAIVALLVGTASPVLAPILDRWLNSDEHFHGVVLSTTGEAIPGASVQLIKFNTVTTNALGQFDIIVPRNRISKTYSLAVSAAGYETPKVATKSVAEMRDIEIRLKPAPAELVQGLGAPLLVSQYYGVPVILVTLKVANKTSSTIKINSITSSVSSKNASFIMSPVYWTILNPFGPFSPVIGPFPIFAGANLDLRVILMTGANFGGFNQKISSLPEYKSAPPCVQKFNGTSDPLSDGAFEIVKIFADEHFTWTSGPWHLRLDVASDNQAISLDRDFEILPADIDRLRASISLLRQCIGANMMSPFAQDGHLVNFVQK